MTEWRRRPVDPARLAFGYWSRGRRTGEGDIHASYSASRIAEGKPIRKPFAFDGHFWVCVGIAGKGLTITGEHEFKAYRLAPPQSFKGEPTTYNAKCNTNEGAAARNDPMGFYHGVRIRCGSQVYIMNGPPEVFIAEAQPERPGKASEPKPEQLSLF